MFRVQRLKPPVCMDSCIHVHEKKTGQLCTHKVGTELSWTSGLVCIVFSVSNHL